MLKDQHKIGYNYTEYTSKSMEDMIHKAKHRKLAGRYHSSRVVFDHQSLIFNPAGIMGNCENCDLLDYWYDSNSFNIAYYIYSTPVSLSVAWKCVPGWLSRRSLQSTCCCCC